MATNTQYFPAARLKAVVSPKCDVPGCRLVGRAMEKVSSYTYLVKGGGEVEIANYRCRADDPHYAFLVLPHRELASKFGMGRFRWTDSRTGEVRETDLPRKHGSRLLPDGRLCPTCGALGHLQGPNPSKRLGEPFWVLRCEKKHATYYWRRTGTLEQLPASALERLHRRTSKPVMAPRCEKIGCPGYGLAMNPQKKRHAVEGGGHAWILHCRCRNGGHDVFLALPGGEPVAKHAWGVYEWKDASAVLRCRTVSKVRPPQRRKPANRPRKDEEAAAIIRLKDVEGKSWSQLTREMNAPRAPSDQKTEEAYRSLYRSRKKVQVVKS